MKETLKKVMKRAWEIKREDKRNIFGECLRMAWAEVKEAAKEEVVTAVKGMKVVFKKIAPWFIKKMDSTTYMAFESGLCVDDLIFEAETEKALCITTEWNGYRKKIWFPKSIIEYRVA